MIVTAEISLYPLAQEAYVDKIWAYIHQLRTSTELDISTNGMSTQVTGEYEQLMSAISSTTKQFFEEEEACVLIFKIVNSDRREA